VTDPYGGRSWTPPGPPPVAAPRRPIAWVALGVPAALVVLLVAVFLVIDGRGPQDVGPSSVAAGSPVPASALEGKWSGEGPLTRCAGFDDEDCSGTRTVTLTVDCSGKRCRATPFDRSYGSPPLRFEEGAYRAAGPVPPDAAPTCGGSPTRSALWRLDVTVQDGRLVGSYAESTIQGFDCGATGLEWELTLERG
jgi:hypothetical protein